MPDNYGRRKTDTIMPYENDHDLLVSLNTRVEVLITQLTGFMQSTQLTQKELAERVARLEVKDRGDSEKFQAISKDVQESLENSKRIGELNTALSNANLEIIGLKDEIKTLRTKSNLFDYINAAGVVLSGIIGSILGSR